MQESVVQCLDCMHDQPHLTFQDDHVVPIEDRWERMVAGTPWVASCTVTVDQDRVEICSGPEAIEFLTYGAFGDAGVREFFTHVRFHKHDEEQIVVHLLVELYARSAQEATEVLEGGRPGPARDHLAGGGVAPAGARLRRGALTQQSVPVLDICPAPRWVACPGVRRGSFSPPSREPNRGAWQEAPGSLDSPCVGRPRS